MKKKLAYILLAFLLICSTAFTATLSSKYVQTLDTFLVKLETYQNNSDYVTLLDNLSSKISDLKSKYGSNQDVSLMIDYLVIGINDLKTKKLSNDIGDKFIADLEGIINETNMNENTSSSSGGTNTNNENKNCVVNIYKVENAYNTVSLDFTFLQDWNENGKIRELDSQGNLTVPYLSSKQTSNPYFFKKNGTDPVVYIYCNNGELTLTDKSLQYLDMSKYYNASSTPKTGNTSSTSSSSSSGGSSTSSSSSSSGGSNSTPTINTQILSASFDKSTNKVRVTIANFQEYSSIMLMNGSNNGTNVGSAVLKCYIVETHSNSSPNCLLATKLSGDYNQATFELSLTDYAIQEGVNKNKMSVYVDNGSISGYNYHSNIIDILPVSGSSTISATIQPQSRTSVSNFLPNVKITTTGLTSCSWCGMSVPCNGTIDMYGSQPQDVGTTHSDTCSFTATKTNGGSVSVDSTSTCTRGALGQPWKCYYPGLNKTW